MLIPGSYLTSKYRALGVRAPCLHGTDGWVLRTRASVGHGCHTVTDPDSRHLWCNCVAPQDMCKTQLQRALFELYVVSMFFLLQCMLAIMFMAIIFGYFYLLRTFPREAPTSIPEDVGRVSVGQGLRQATELPSPAQAARPPCFTLHTLPNAVSRPAAAVVPP